MQSQMIVIHIITQLQEQTITMVKKIILFFLFPFFLNFILYLFYYFTLKFLFLTKVVLEDLLDIFQETLQNVNLITITFQLEILQS